MQNQNFQFKVSATYLLLTLVLLVMSSVLVLIQPLSFYLQLLLLLLIIFYGGYIIWRYVLLLSALSIIGLSHYEGQWLALTKNSLFFNVSLLGDSLHTRFIIVLRMRDEWAGKLYTAIILPDMLAKNEFQQLQMRLGS